MIRLLILLFTALTLAGSDGRIYYLLWFDTEDYIEPAADDAALRLATDLEKAGVRATFKVVGEKARVSRSPTRVNGSRRTSTTSRRTSRTRFSTPAT